MGDPREVNMSSPLQQSRANEECLPLHPGQCMDKVRVIDVSSPISRWLEIEAPLHKFQVKAAGCLSSADSRLQTDQE